MNGVIRVPEPLRAARAGLAELDGVDVLREFEWDSDAGAWILVCRLYISAPRGIVPTRTTWYVHAEDTYPWGNIKIFPAKRGGLETTYPHQSLNEPGSGNQLWRTGKLCVDTGVHALGRGLDTEPFEAYLRLAWRLRRARAWLEAADAGMLVLPGEPFELPDFDTPVAPTLGFWEDGGTFSAWSAINASAGEVLLTRLRDQPDLVAAIEFRGGKGGQVLLSPPWGQYISANVGERALGLWIKLPDVPHLEPWRAPLTWGELAAAASAMGVDLFAILEGLAPRIRDGKRHYLLIGFPLPARAGDPPCRIYWQPMLLPRLSSTKRDGFRSGPKAGWVNDRARIFRTDSRITWVKGENWSSADLAGRGRLPARVTGRCFLIVGAGALGAPIAEMLVRGGVTTLNVSDGDHVKAGNLVRHTLSLRDVGIVKGVAVADRINAASSGARVTALSNFPPKGDVEIEAVQRSDVVIDMTGSDVVLAALAAFPWAGPRLFLSISIGFRAQRLFCFAAAGSAFPHQEFIDRMQPWLQREQEEAAPAELAREGVGCWHPVFPARVDDIWMLASAAVKWIEQCVVSEPATPTLTVFEQEHDGNAFFGLRRIHG